MEKYINRDVEHPAEHDSEASEQRVLSDKGREERRTRGGPGSSGAEWAVVKLFIYLFGTATDVTAHGPFVCCSCIYIGTRALGRYFVLTRLRVYPCAFLVLVHAGHTH